MAQAPEASDPWDGIKPAGGQFVKWLEVGDRIVGEVTEVSKGKTIDGEPCPQIVVLTEDGDERTITASQALLRNALLEQRPRVGDTVDITLTGIDTTGGRTLKEFQVLVTPF